MVTRSSTVSPRSKVSFSRRSGTQARSRTSQKQDIPPQEELTGLKLIGKGEKDGGWLANMLDCSITDTFQPMEANGLILMNVKYPGIKWNIDSYARSRALEKIHELFISRETVARMLEEIERGMQ